MISIFDFDEESAKRIGMLAAGGLSAIGTIRYYDDMRKNYKTRQRVKRLIPQHKKGDHDGT